MAIYKNINSHKPDDSPVQDNLHTKKNLNDSASDNGKTLGFSGYKDISNLASLGEFSVANSSTRKRDFT